MSDYLHALHSKDITKSLGGSVGWHEQNCEHVENTQKLKGRNMLGVCPELAFNIPKTLPTHVHHMPKSYPKHVQTLPNHARNIQETCWNHARIDPKSIQNHSKVMPKS